MFNNAVNNGKHCDNKLQFLQAEPYDADYLATIADRAAGSVELPDPRPIQPGDHTQHNGQERGCDEQAAKSEPPRPSYLKDHCQRTGREDEEEKSKPGAALRRFQNSLKVQNAVE